MRGALISGLSCATCSASARRAGCRIAGRPSWPRFWCSWALPDAGWSRFPHGTHSSRLCAGFRHRSPPPATPQRRPLTPRAARALIVCAAMAVAAGLVGCFAVMRRMTLAADAFSHVALPGIGLALVLRLNPLIGALVALLAGSMLIWAIEGRTKLSTEAITGVVFSVALAIGSLTATGEELIDALFGTPGSMTIAETD